MRQTLTAILGRSRGRTAATASDPLIPLDKTRVRRPDAIVLDLEMPRMDGLTFLGKLMAEDLIRVVVCSGLAGRGTEEALRAVDEGGLARRGLRRG